MKIFVSGKWTEKQSIRIKMNELEEMGHQITFDWTSFEEEGDGPEKMRQAGINDINGVRDAQILISDMSDPDYAYRGTFCELGCALALDKPVFLLCPNPEAICRQQPFFYHPNVHHFTSWTDLLSVLEN